MGEPYRTSAANIEEGQEVRIGGRWRVVEDASSDGETVTLWIEEYEYTFAVGEQLAVCV